MFKWGRRPIALVATKKPTVSWYNHVLSYGILWTTNSIRTTNEASMPFFTDQSEAERYAQNRPYFHPLAIARAKEAMGFEGSVPLVRPGSIPARGLESSQRRRFAPGLHQWLQGDHERRSGLSELGTGGVSTPLSYTPSRQQSAYTRGSRGLSFLPMGLNLGK